MNVTDSDSCEVSGANVEPAHEKPFDDQFLTKSWREDVTIHVSGRKFYVSSSVMSLYSPVFNKTFEQLSSNGKPMELEMKEFRCEQVLEFLQCLYPTVQKKIDKKNFLMVLPLAIEYKTESLRKSCMDVLMSQINSDADMKDLCSYIKTACTFDMKLVKDKCIDHLLEKNYETFIKESEEQDFPTETKHEIQHRMCMHLSRKMHRLESLSENYAKILKKVGIKKMWFDKPDDESGDFSKGIVGFLEYSLPIPGPKSEQSSPTVTIHDIDWRIMVKVSGDSKDLGFFLKATPRGEILDWSCRVHAILSLQNINSKSLSREVDHIFTGKKDDWGFLKFAQIADLRQENSGFLDKGKIHLDIKFIANEPDIKFKN